MRLTTPRDATMLHFRQNEGENKRGDIGEEGQGSDVSHVTTSLDLHVLLQCFRDHATEVAGITRL